jgi:hypothetical protein
MLYAIFCYHHEDTVFAWSKAEDDAVLDRLHVVHEKLAAKGKLGPSVRLMPTTAATTLLKDREPALVVDGPFAETKEQLLGFYVVDFENLEEAIGYVREMGVANPGGAYEIRPVRAFLKGADVSGRELAAAEQV